MPIRIQPDASEVITYTEQHLPIYLNSCLISDYEYHVLWHWHDALEFLYIEEGCMEVYIGGELHVLQQGEGIFLNSRHLHSTKSPNLQECRYTCLLLHPDLLRNMSQLDDPYVFPLINHPNFITLALRQSDETKNILTILFEMQQHCLQKRPGYELLVHSLCLRLGFELYQHISNVSRNELRDAKDMHHLKAMLTHIKLNYQEAIPLQQLALSAMISRSTCCSLFQTYMHQTPTAYITAFRIQKSKYYLSSTQHSITQVGMLCGFNDSSYFTKVFSKHTGHTPKQYRNKHRYQNT